jgi:hypothetical protein
MKITLIRAIGAVGALALAAALPAGGQTLLYSFETLYNDQGMPDPLGTRPDGFHFTGGGTTVTQATNGVTDGSFSMRFEQNVASTFTGAITEIGAPFPVIDDAATTAVAADFTVQPGDEYPGGFANLGITVFGDNATLGEGQAQTVVASEQPVKLAPGTYRIVLPLIARFNPYTFDLDVPFHTILGTDPNTQMTATSFQFYVNKGGAAGNGTFIGYFDNVRALGNPIGTWNFDADANWGEAINWLGLPNPASPVPNGVDHIAMFGLTINAARTITVDAPRTVGALYFNNGNSYTLAGTNSITMDVSSGAARIDSHSGSHTIGVPLALNDDLLVSVGTVAGAPNASILTLSSPLNAPARAVTKNGSARLDFGPISLASLTVNSGTALLRAGSGTSRLQSLTIATGAGGEPRRLDVTDTALVIDYPSGGPSPVATIRTLLSTGYANGSWNGNGIVTTNGTATTHGVGYAEASALPSVPPVFGTVDSTSLLIRFTRFGDANLDSTVNLADFNRLAGNFGTGSRWDQGDFNYDGTVNLADFNRLAGNFGQSAAGAVVTPQDWARLAGAIPEPAGSAVAAAGLIVIASRRRRH